MSIYLKPILTACYVFPVLAALFTLPYIIRQYHKYGSILVLRTGIVYTFIFYMMTSYFMTILPLPAIDSVTPESATMLLTPFDAVRRWLDGCSFVLTDFSTYKDTFTNPTFYRLSLISCYFCRLAYICGITLTADGIRFYCFLFYTACFLNVHS